MWNEAECKGPSDPFMERAGNAGSGVRTRKSHRPEMLMRTGLIVADTSRGLERTQCLVRVDLVTIRDRLEATWGLMQKFGVISKVLEPGEWAVVRRVGSVRFGRLMYY